VDRSLTQLVHVEITVCQTGNPNVRLSFSDLKYGLSFETCQ